MYVASIPHIAYALLTNVLDHIHLYMHPQVMIVDGSSSEEAFFTEAVWKQSRDLQIPLIEIPHNGAKKLGYLAKLDSASLSGTTLLPTGALPALTRILPRTKCGANSALIS